MNVLTAVEIVRELLINMVDEYSINTWVRRVRRAEDPLAELATLRACIKQARLFEEWLACANLHHETDLNVRNKVEKLYLFLYPASEIEAMKESLLEESNAAREREKLWYDQYFKQQDAMRLC